MGRTTQIAKLMGPTFMGPTWGPQDPGGPHVGPMNLAIRETTSPKGLSGEKSYLRKKGCYIRSVVVIYYHILSNRPSQDNVYGEKENKFTWK